jgi:hypothetical protein
MTEIDPESTAAALGVALAHDKHRAEATEREVWRRAAYYVKVGLPLSSALRILGCSRTTWYRKTAEWRRGNPGTEKGGTRDHLPQGGGA